MERGGTAPAILNVVNELAVYAFLNEKIMFTRITELVEKALSKISIKDDPNLEDILEVEKLGNNFISKEIDL